MIDNYRLISPAYDTLERLYSADAIRACKLAMMQPDIIKQGQRLLFAGAGSGEDAIAAARLGARVTVVDLSPAMIARFKQRLSQQDDRASLAIECIQGDVLKLDHEHFYDVVVANFFLSVFERGKMLTLLRHLRAAMRSDGSLIVGDFAPSAGSLLNRSIQNMYWYTAATLLFALTGNAIHPIYDYAAILHKEGFEVVANQPFGIAGRALFQSILANHG